MTDARWTDKQKKQMDILENLKVKKIIRAHGVSVHSLEAMEAAAEIHGWMLFMYESILMVKQWITKILISVIPVIEKLHQTEKDNRNEADRKRKIQK